MIRSAKKKKEEEEKRDVNLPQFRSDNKQCLQPTHLSLLEMHGRESVRDVTHSGAWLYKVRYGLPSFDLDKPSTPPGKDQNLQLSLFPLPLLNCDSVISTYPLLPIKVGSVDHRPHLYILLT